MKMRMLGAVSSVAAALTFAATSLAGPVDFHVDSAPNVYGSPDWDPWWTNAKQDVVNDSFTNMRTGTYPGTNQIHPHDFIVYSDGDLGKRIHWLYWLEGETTTDLQDRFEVKWVFDWDGVDYTYDWVNRTYLVDDPNAGWIEPGSWEDYDDGTNQGVIGSFGFAFWAQPDSSQRDALAADIFRNQTYLTGLYRYRDSINSEWTGGKINLTVVPLPAPALLGLAGLAGTFALGWRRRTGSI